MESLEMLSDEELLQVKELINETFIPKNNQKTQEERKQLILSLQGKYAHAPTSSEDFALQKQVEIDWE
jgi:hypothetical protein